MNKTLYDAVITESKNQWQFKSQNKSIKGTSYSIYSKEVSYNGTTYTVYDYLFEKNGKFYIMYCSIKDSNLMESLIDSIN